MKYLFKVIFIKVILLFCFLLNNDSYAQRLERNVPIIVTEAFQKKFPKQEPVWFSEYQGRFNQKLVYEARFMFDNRYSKAFYENEGKMLAFATVVEQSELPEVARVYMKENYPSFPITEALLVTYANNEIQFEVGIYIDNEFVVQVFSKAGDFIKTAKG